MTHALLGVAVIRMAVHGPRCAVPCGLPPQALLVCTYMAVVGIVQPSVSFVLFVMVDSALVLALLRASKNVSFKPVKHAVLDRCLFLRWAHIA